MNLSINAVPKDSGTHNISNGDVNGLTQVLKECAMGVPSTPTFRSRVSAHVFKQGRTTKQVTVNLHPKGVYEFERFASVDLRSNCLGLVGSQYQVAINGNGATLRVKNGCSFRFIEVQGELHAKDCVFEGGNTVGEYGGAFFVAKKGRLCLTNCVVRHNRTVGQAGEEGPRTGGAGGGGGQAGLGGAVFLEQDAELTLDSCEFVENSAVGGAGGSAHPNGGSFSAAGGCGGGIDYRSGEPCKTSGGARGPNPGSNSNVFGGGGGGGGSSGHQGGEGGKGAFPGGGGGGAGGLTLGGWEGVAEFGVGGFGGGRGGKAGASSGSAGGGGAGFGGAVFACRSSRVVIKASKFVRNSCQGGKGGSHGWGFPSGHRGQAMGGALFTWEVTETTLQDNSFESNQADTWTSCFDFARFRDSHNAMKMVSKAPLKDALGGKLNLPKEVLKMIVDDYLDCDE